MQTTNLQRFGKNRTLRVECVQGHTYELDLTRSQLGPHVCGVCGALIVRLWELVYVNANAGEKHDQTKDPAA